MLKLLRSGFSHFRGDLAGGITAGIVALPLALAFGEQTELGAIAGLYGAIAISIFAALFGGTPTQISGPTAPMTVVSAVVIADAVSYAGGLANAIPIIIATFFLAGLIEMLMGVVKLGKYIRFIPYPVVSGFMSGIGVIIIITQIFPFFGMEAPAGGPLGTIRAIHKIPEIVNMYSIGAALLTIGMIYLIPRISKKIPAALIALLLVSLATYFLLPAEAMLRLNSEGPIPTGLPDLHLNFWGIFGDFNHLTRITEYAFTLAALGAIDSLLTSLVADNITKTRHNSNQELIGQGIGNMISSLVGGIPGAGATMRTVINVRSGGRTRLSGVLAGLLLLIILLGGGQMVGYIPNAVLAGILITVGISIIDYKGFRHINSVPRADAIILIVVLLLTVFVDLLIAVAVGMVLASVLFMKKISEVVEHKMDSAQLKEFSREIPWSDEGDFVQKFGDHVYIFHLNGPLFFGFASRFNAILKALPDIHTVIIRMDRVTYVDQSGMYAMEEAIEDFLSRDIQVVITGLHGQAEDYLRRVRIIPGLVAEDLVFPDFKSCVEWLRSHGLHPSHPAMTK
ncbi:MAG: SulP family inorganic anion transporter [Saprospiraceae bacterium]